MSALSNGIITLKIMSYGNDKLKANKVSLMSINFLIFRELKATAHAIAIEGAKFVTWRIS